MGKGPGRVQRFVLETLADLRREDLGREVNGNQWPYHFESAPDLAAKLAGGEPTLAEVEAMRRAIRTLAARGEVEIGHWEWADRYVHEYKPARKMLRARLPLTPEQRAREDEADRRRQEAHESRLASFRASLRG